VRKDGTRPVPMHLRNAPTQLMKDLGYGKGYRYAHDEAGGFAAGETYFPEGMSRRSSTGRSSAGWRSASPTSCASCGR
jgi:replication-associated recombination protein RarA